MNSKLSNNSEVRFAIEAIQSWLLGPEVQLAEGPHRGGIVGWVGEDGSPVFLYPEIAGYYLSWLGFFAFYSNQIDEAARRANLVLSWIDNLFSNGTGLQTRIYLGNRHPDDWRNRGFFLFDLAMLARGLALVWNFADAGNKWKIRDHLIQQLLLFCRDSGSLQAFRPHAAAFSPLPHWSCVEGPYQTKAAAAILSANEVEPVPSWLCEAARSVYGRWRTCSQSPSSGDLHAVYYHLEGLVIAAANGWDPQALSSVENATMKNRLLCAPGIVASMRSDVIAQALRIGSILWDRCNQRHAASNPVQHLADLLQQFLTTGGAVLFCQEATLRHRNVWSSMFAHQALCYFEAVTAGLPLEKHWLQFFV